MLQTNYKLRSLIAVGMMLISANAMSQTDSDKHAIGFVDSAYEWGAWEFGLQPAAGGPAPAPGRVVAVNNPRRNFRPNDSSAFAPKPQASAVVTVSPTPIPPSIPLPTASPAGTGPLPTGGPGDRF